MVACDGDGVGSVVEDVCDEGGDGSAVGGQFQAKFFSLCYEVIE